MKRAVLYARVSGDLQAKEGTIESQVLALRKQIAAAARGPQGGVQVQLGFSERAALERG